MTWFQKIFNKLIRYPVSAICRYPVSASEASICMDLYESVWICSIAGQLTLWEYKAYSRSKNCIVFELYSIQIHTNTGIQIHTVWRRLTQKKSRTIKKTIKVKNKISKHGKNFEKSSVFSLNMLTQFQTLLNTVAWNSSLEWLHSKYP